ncbi:MAG: ABC transporter substrate-binding protein, partial [Planctomycetota bacterium]
MTHAKPSRGLALAILIAAATGCGSGPASDDPLAEAAGSSAKPAADNAAQASDSDSAADSAADSDADSGGEAAKPFVLGDLIEPFDPPTLEEVDASASWVDRPVRDALEVMRELIADREVELTAEEALELKNDSPANNAKMLAALGQLAPADGSGVDYGETVVRHVTGDLKSTNPVLASSVTEQEYHSLTAIGLITFDKNFEWFGVADVIETWQTSEDRLIDKFVLRDDLYWSDGTKVTAHDFAFTFQVIMTDAVFVPAVRQGTDQLKGVVAYDDRTLVYFHKESLPINTENIQFFPLPKHRYETTIADDPTLSRSDAHSALEDKPVVAGPYELVKRSRGQEFVFR